jgi:hypothetical protein
VSSRLRGTRRGLWLMSIREVIRSQETSHYISMIYFKDVCLVYLCVCRSCWVCVHCSMASCSGRARPRGITLDRACALTSPSRTMDKTRDSLPPDMTHTRQGRDVSVAWSIWVH